MTRLLPILLLTACTYTVPVSQFVLPPNACEPGPAEFTWQGETKAYVLHVTDSAGQLYEWCGADAAACIRGSDIYVPMPCEKPLAHELNHLFGQHWIDGPAV